MPEVMKSFIEHRADRLRAASAYEGWDRPPYPFQTPEGRCVGRAIISSVRVRTGNAVITLPAGLLRFTFEIEALFKAKEKEQNRTAFKY